MIDNAFDAFWFLHNHYECVTEDPQHPFTDEPLGTRNTFKNTEITEPWQKNNRDYWRGQLINNLDILITKVNPVTNTVEDDANLNTAVRVWLETGSAMWDDWTQSYIGNTHDPLLDVGGATFEEALINLANAVSINYGDRRVEE